VTWKDGREGIHVIEESIDAESVVTLARKYCRNLHVLELFKQDLVALLPYEHITTSIVPNTRMGITLIQGIASKLEYATKRFF
jgi:hypothetical protein